MKGAGTLPEKAYSQLKHMFLTDQLVHGQKLRYQDLAKRLGMSQTPVIMALVRLEDEGLVRSEANKGYFVPELDLEEARELYEVRLLLEVFLIPKVVDNLTEQSLAELEALRRAHKEVRGTVYQRERLWRDAQLHLALAATSGNQVVTLILRRVFDLLYLRYRPEILSPQRFDEAEGEHAAIFEALRARDGVAAAELLRQHVERGQWHILNGLRQQMERRESMLQALSVDLALAAAGAAPAAGAPGAGKRSARRR
ncbi:MAG: GntR family transcriptional regulator [Thermodesulfobacteriota bacterium]